MPSTLETCNDVADRPLLPQAGATLYQIDTKQIIVCSDASGPVWKTYDSAGSTSTSAIKSHANTWAYWDFGDAVSTGTFGTSGQFNNVADGTSSLDALADLPDSTYGRYYPGTIIAGDATGAFEVSLGGDPFGAATNGLSMGVLFENTMDTSDILGRGIMFYGDSGADNHFYVRANMTALGTIKVGEDNTGSDQWSVVTTLNTLHTWMFVVLTQNDDSGTDPATKGTIQASINGGTLADIRTGGLAVSPTAAVMGLAGDPYGDNDSGHAYASAWWYKGKVSQSQINAEYAHLKLRFPDLGLP